MEILPSELTCFWKGHYGVMGPIQHGLTWAPELLLHFFTCKMEEILIIREWMTRSKYDASLRLLLVTSHRIRNMCLCVCA